MKKWGNLTEEIKMELNQIRLHCSNCEPSAWVNRPRNKVVINLSLEKDEYEFFANCPRCLHPIYNTRRAFSR